jgi:hypothetical protein
MDADPSADLTALHWSSDGTLLAIASFDSVLRVCTEEGERFFESTVHEVGICTSGVWFRISSSRVRVRVFELREVLRVSSLFFAMRCMHATLS